MAKKFVCQICEELFPAVELALNEANHTINVCEVCHAGAVEELQSVDIATLIEKGKTKKEAKAIVAARDYTKKAHKYLVDVIENEEEVNGEEDDEEMEEYDEGDAEVEDDEESDEVDVEDDEEDDDEPAAPVKPVTKKVVAAKPAPAAPVKTKKVAAAAAAAPAPVAVKEDPKLVKLNAKLKELKSELRHAEDEEEEDEIKAQIKAVKSKIAKLSEVEEPAAPVKTKKVAAAAAPAPVVPVKTKKGSKNIEQLKIQANEMLKAYRNEDDPETKKEIGRQERVLRAEIKALREAGVEEEKPMRKSRSANAEPVSAKPATKKVAAAAPAAPVKSAKVEPVTGELEFKVDTAALSKRINKVVAEVVETVTAMKAKKGVDKAEVFEELGNAAVRDVVTEVLNRLLTKGAKEIGFSIYKAVRMAKKNF